MKNKNQIDLKAIALMKHFGLSRKEVKIPRLTDYDDEFMLNFGYGNKDVPIEVVTKDVAYNNSVKRGIFFDIEDITKNQIGNYSRLIDTDYFFRLL